jgi:hypothetical protein
VLSENLTAERRLGGAGMRLAPAEKREIAIAYLTDPDLGTITACAKHFTHTREAISACLRGDEFEALRTQVDIEAGDEAKGILKRARVKAAKAWVDTAIDAAAERGDHKPAKDLLVATHVIEPAPAGSAFYVGILVSGQRKWIGSDGCLLDELPPNSSLGIGIGLLDGEVQVSMQPPTTGEGGVRDCDRQTSASGEALTERLSASVIDREVIK